MTDKSFWKSKKILVLIGVFFVTTVVFWDYYILMVRAQNENDPNVSQTPSPTASPESTLTRIISATLTTTPTPIETVEDSNSSGEATPIITVTIEITATPLFTVTISPTATNTTKPEPPLTPTTIVKPDVTSTPTSEATETASIYGDTNQDGVVDQGDLDFITAQFGSSNPMADINGDGEVNVLDLSIVVELIEQLHSNNGEPKTTATPIPTATATPIPTTQSDPNNSDQDEPTPTPIQTEPTPEVIDYREDYEDYEGYEDYSYYDNSIPRPPTFAPGVISTATPAVEATPESSPLYVESYSDSVTDFLVTDKAEDLEPFYVPGKVNNKAAVLPTIQVSSNNLYIEETSTETSTLVNNLTLINSCGDAFVEQPVIDICYLVFVARNYGNQSSKADINLDGLVDIQDLIAVANNYDQPVSDLWQIK